MADIVVDIAALRSARALVVSAGAVQESMTTPQWQTIGNLSFNATTMRLEWKGAEVDVSAKSAHALIFILRHSPEFVTYRQIYDVFRGVPGFHSGDGPKGFHTNVRTIIKRLRKAFLNVDPGFDQIETHSAVGYRWRP